MTDEIKQLLAWANAGGTPPSRTPKRRDIWTVKDSATGTKVAHHDRHPGLVKRHDGFRIYVHRGTSNAKRFDRCTPVDPSDLDLNQGGSGLDNRTYFEARARPIPPALHNAMVGFRGMISEELLKRVSKAQ